MSDPYAILSANAALDEYDSTVVFSGPTTTLERIRTENPDVDVQYLAYRKMRT